MLDAANTVMGGLLGVAAILGAGSDPTVVASGATDGASGLVGELAAAVEVHGVVDLHGGVVGGAVSIGDLAAGVVVDVCCGGRSPYRLRRGLGGGRRAH